MRPRNLKRKDRWYLPKEHTFFRQGYVYNRNGICYLCIGSYRKTVNIPFTINNKEFVLELLVKTIKDLKYSSISDMNSISQAIAMYYKVNSNLSEKRMYVLKRAVKIFITKDFFLHEADAIRNHIIDNIKLSKDKYKQNSIAVYIAALTQIFTFLQSEGYIKKNPLNKSIVNEKIEEATIHLYTKEELEMIFEATKDKPLYHYLYKFLYLTGCRIAEATNLKWVDVKEDYIEILGKGKKIRTIPFAPFPEIKKLLGEIKSFNNGEKIFPLANTTYKIYLSELLVKLGIKEVGKNTHSFRKTRENELIHNQYFSTKIIAELLGHTEAVQKKHYLKVLKSDELSKNLLREMEMNKNFTHEAHDK